MADQMVSNSKTMHQHDGYAAVGTTPGGITRERSFVRSNSQQNHHLNHQHHHHNHQNKRRSLAFNHDIQQQLRAKPAIEIYRPPNVRLDGVPNKLNVNAPEFTISREQSNVPSSFDMYSDNNQYLQHSKSSGNIQQQMQLAAARRHAVQMANTAGPRILVQHPLQMQLGLRLNGPQMQLNATNPANGPTNEQIGPKVKFALDQPNNDDNNRQPKSNGPNLNNIQRSKSLSSADALARGIASLGLGVANESNDIGIFKPEMEAIIEQALSDPNQLNARSLMVLANQIMQRAVEGRRYALSTSRFCISIIAKEQKETFLEAILNNCRQWYKEREPVLGPPQKIKNSARPRFTAFMAFLTEMFCQLKRRQLQLRTKCDGVPPPIVLLTVLSKCCEDCVKPPVRSLSEIECLFYVLTCVGRDIETHLPQQLELLLSMVRDAFLNSSASAPTIRRTLLQLIELQASQWQLPGNTVLYYYPTAK